MNEKDLTFVQLAAAIDKGKKTERDEGRWFNSYELALNATQEKLGRWRLCNKITKKEMGGWSVNVTWANDKKGEKMPPFFN